MRSKWERPHRRSATAATHHADGLVGRRDRRSLLMDELALLAVAAVPRVAERTADLLLGHPAFFCAVVLVAKDRDHRAPRRPRALWQTKRLLGRQSTPPPQRKKRPLTNESTSQATP